MSDRVIEVRDLRVRFRSEGKSIEAVNGISFEVRQGQTLGIVGESGSGKSVTSLSIMGLVPQPPGEIVGGDIWFRARSPEGRLLDPVNLLQLSERDMERYRGRQIATIFQEPMSALNPVYTVEFQLVEALRQHRPELTAQTARQEAIRLLQEVQLVPADGRRSQQILQRYPHQLSGGQIQRVTIAMAISCNPALLIADEPTTALDVTVQAQILQLLRQLRDDRQMSMIFITHDLGVIAEIADTVAVMYRGKIVEYGSVWDIFSNPQHPYTKGLLACRPDPNRRLTRLLTVADYVREEIDMGGDRRIVEIAPEPPPEISPAAVADRLTSLQSQPPLLQVRDLQVGFRDRGMFGQTKRYFMAVNGITFDVYPGETLGLVGESGCGKTTLARALLRLIEPMSGSVIFDGKEITQLRGQELRSLRRNLQIVFQDPYSSLNPRMTIGALVMEPLEVNEMGRSHAERWQRAAYLLERVGLDPDWMKRYPHEFSGGQRQRICIARALALNPRFVICDESVSALDVSVQAQVLNLFKELQAEFQLTYIFISHDLSVVKFMSDRILVMNRGKIEELGAADRVYHNPQREYTRTLIESIPTGTLERIRYQQERQGASEQRAAS